MRNVKGNRRWIIAGTLIGVVILVGFGLWLVGTSLSDGPSSYTQYASASEVTQQATVGQRVKVALQVDLSGAEYRYEGSNRGLVVEAPPAGFKTGRHVYYLQIVTSEPRLTEAAIFGTGKAAQEKKEFLVAHVIRIE